jgi:hypothetical protein
MPSASSPVRLPSRCTSSGSRPEIIIDIGNYSLQCLDALDFYPGAVALLLHQQRQPSRKSNAVTIMYET